MPGSNQRLDLFIKVLRVLCPNLTDASKVVAVEKTDTRKKENKKIVADRKKEETLIIVY